MTTTAPLDEAPHAADAPVGLGTALEQAQRALAGVRDLVVGDRAQELDERGLLDAQGAMTSLKRESELVMAALCAEIARRSSLDRGSQGLARQQGFTNPATMIAAATGSSRRDADRLIRAGRTMADARSSREPSGESAAAQDHAPAYPHVAAALAARELSVEHAGQITRMLDGVAGAVSAEQIAVAESALVSKAAGLTVEQFTPVVARWRNALVERDAEARQERLHGQRCVVFTDLPDGSVKLDGRLDPVTAAPVRAALDGMVKDALRRRRDGDPLAEDRRSPGQVRADALAVLARHMLGCEAAPVTHATTTVVVRMSLDQLRDGAGMAQVDGSGAIPASQVRTAAVDAGYVPVVLGGESLPLDVGRRKRRFTPAQITALLERDGGCAMCGAPPSHCEAHHIDWWDRDGGTTDLSNGVMLCVACHHTIHRQAWEIDASRDDVWFRPPASIDPRRAPRLGGTGRFGVTARERRALATAAQEGQPPTPPGEPPQRPPQQPQDRVPAGSPAGSPEHPPHGSLERPPEQPPERHPEHSPERSDGTRSEAPPAPGAPPRPRSEPPSPPAGPRAPWMTDAPPPAWATSPTKPESRPESTPESRSESTPESRSVSTLESRSVSTLAPGERSSRTGPHRRTRARGGTAAATPSLF